MAEYTSSGIEKITGMSRRKVQFLVDFGIVEPKERGRGKAIVYTESNLIEIMMTKILQEQKVTNLKIKGIFDHLKEENNDGKYTDFFTDYEWGVTKDLVHVTSVDKRGITQRATVEVKMNYVIPENVMKQVVRPANGPIMMIPLGKVKRSALQRMNLNL